MCRWHHLLILVILVSGCKQPAVDSWDRYARAIDEHVAAYVQFTADDESVRKRILEEYERAKQIRHEYHQSGKIPADPLVRVITPGDNLFLFDSTNVGVFLAPLGSLECSGLEFRKMGGAPGQIVVVGGNKGFWYDRRADAKFISTTLTLPANENTLRTESNSWSPGKIIVLGKVIGVAAVVLGLSGCTDKTEQKLPTNPEGGCAQPSPPVTIDKGTLMNTAVFKVADSQAAQDYLIGPGQGAAAAALAAKKAALAQGKCISPCVATWSPEPAITGRIDGAGIMAGGGALNVVLDVVATATLVCAIP